MSSANNTGIYARKEESKTGGGQHIKLFKPEAKVAWHALSGKTTGQVRILPGFDRNLSVADEAFKTSYVPYRELAGGQEDENATPAFTGWNAMLKTYRWWGPQGKSFISPLLNDPNWPMSGVDPIFDLFSYINNLKNPDLIPLIKAPPGAGMKHRIPLSMPKFTGYMNALMLEPQSTTWDNKLLMLTAASLGHLEDSTLRERSSKSEAVISEMWPDFLMGDITDPFTGSSAHVEPKRLGSSTVESACLEFFKDETRLASRKEMVFDPASELGKQYLSNRYDIGEVLHIPTYQEIVGYVVEGGDIPYDIVQGVCGPHCGDSLPANPKVTTNVSTTSAETTPAETQQEAPPAETRQQAAVTESLTTEEEIPEDVPFNEPPATGASTEAVSGESGEELVKIVTDAVGAQKLGVELDKEAAIKVVAAFKKAVKQNVPGITTHVADVLTIQTKFGIQ